MGADTNREHDYNYDEVRAAAASAFASYRRALQLGKRESNMKMSIIRKGVILARA